MDRLVKQIEDIRGKLSELRRLSLKETPTRTIVIDPLLESLGWDVRDPVEVELEYPTIDGKSVDYALKINEKPALLVEAKALDDPLNHVKAITQVVGYAANDGIVWCILTNGLCWKVYRSVEKCQAPDKLMFEVTLDPKASEGLPVQQLAEQMWRFSREEMAKGTLDALGEKTFTDGKIRKALDHLMRDPPRPLILLIRKAMGDGSLPPQKVKDSLLRVWKDTGIGSSAMSGTVSGIGEAASFSKELPKKSAEKARETRQSKRHESLYDEAHHISGKPHEVIELYRGIEKLCFSLKPGGIQKYFLAKCINFEADRRTFCSIHLLQGGLRVWLWIKYNQIQNPPAFARDVSKVGHWGGGSVELGLSSLAQLDEAERLIRMSFDLRS